MMLTIVTLGFMFFDIITGLCQSFFNKTWTSSIMREGLFHKLGLVMAIVLAYLIQYVQILEPSIPISIPSVIACNTLIIIMETGSILENLKKLNPEIGNVITIKKDEQ